MHSSKRALVFGCLLFVAANAFAQSVSTPPAGSAERKAIMDVLRVPCERDLGLKVIFKVQHLRVSGDWAFARVVPVQPDGSDIDYSRTQYREDLGEGAFDAEAETLLRREGGQWKLVEWRFGATDTEVELWLAKYRFPKSLLN